MPRNEITVVTDIKRSDALRSRRWHRSWEELTVGDGDCCQRILAKGRGDYFRGTVGSLFLRFNSA